MPRHMVEEDEYEDEASGDEGEDEGGGMEGPSRGFRPSPPRMVQGRVRPGSMLRDRGDFERSVTGVVLPADIDRDKLFQWMQKRIAQAPELPPPTRTVRGGIESKRVYDPAKAADPLAKALKARPSSMALAKPSSRRAAAPEPEEDEGENEGHAEREVLIDPSTLRDQDMPHYKFELRVQNECVELFHYSPHGSKSLEALADEVCEVASDTASQRGGTPQSEMDGLHQMDEPSVTGQVAQQMRHAEVLLQQVMNSTSTRERSLLRENESLRKRCQELENGRIAMIQQYEEMMSDKHARELQVRQIEKSEERKEKIADGLLIGIPTVLNRLLGARALPEPSTPEREMMKGIMGSLTEEQFQKLQAILTPEQIVGLASLYSSFAEQEEKGSSGVHTPSPPPPQQQHPQPSPQSQAHATGYMAPLALKSKKK